MKEGQFSSNTREERKKEIKHRWGKPFVWLDWQIGRFNHWLNSFASLNLLRSLVLLGTAISLIVGAGSYYLGKGDRTKQKHYQAWQTINLAQGKTGSGGRIQALEELNKDHVSLAGVDVSKAYLVEINLPGANLFKADLHEADLQHANLRKAHLAHADLCGAHLYGAHLDGACLAGANLRGTGLGGAYLQGADLTGAKFQKNTLSEDQTHRIDLAGAYLQKAYLYRVNLSKADLYGSKLQGADLQHANLRGANLLGTNFLGANLQETDLQKANLLATNFRGTKLQGANLAGADLCGADLAGADIAGADLRGTILYRANFPNNSKQNITQFLNIIGVNIQEVNLHNVRNITAEQLSKVKTLYHAILDPKIEEQIRKNYPHLLEEPKDIKEGQKQ